MRLWTIINCVNMRNHLILGLVVFQLFFVGSGIVSAQADPNTGSLNINLSLPDYTLTPTTSSKYGSIVGKYFVLKSVSVTPSSDSAVIEWKLTRSKAAPSPTIRIEYGIENTSEHSVSTTDGVTQKMGGNALVVRELQPNTEYRFRVTASIGTLYNEGTSVRSPEFSFVTPASGESVKKSFQLMTPKVKLKSFSTGKAAARIIFQTDISTTALLEYAEFKPYFVYTGKKEDAVRARTHTLAISGLKSNTLYPYRIMAKGADGTETTFDGFVFKTKVK